MFQTAKNKFWMFLTQWISLWGNVYFNWPEQIIVLWLHGIFIVLNPIDTHCY